MNEQRVTREPWSAAMIWWAVFLGVEAVCLGIWATLAVMGNTYWFWRAL